jgi:DNA-binding transcriptional ArsR family regulator
MRLQPSDWVSLAATPSVAVPSLKTIDPPAHPVLFAKSPTRYLREQLLELRKPFLGGTLPWKWVAAASCLPGKAPAVAMALAHLAHCENRWEISVTLASFLEFGISRAAASRAITLLKDAGLIRAKRGRGRPIRITINDDPDAYLMRCRVRTRDRYTENRARAWEEARQENPRSAQTPPTATNLPY